ncbi:hypothetical protein BD410DRAFT_844526 [Rickenella mellea]|uniref:Uncharacterized protein n=1 Tax=Rickenella mellea TaxID=50990 RepID=A0A4Y7PMV4_9AGAM|nr:hypothetical protein BD410DRAFT_844526 [Rickenella mellea]
MHLYSLTIPRSDMAIHLPGIADEVSTSFNDAPIEQQEVTAAMPKTEQQEITAAMPKTIPTEQCMSKEEVTAATPKTKIRSAAKIRGKEIKYFYFYYLSSKAWDCPPDVPNAQPGDLLINRISKAFGAAWSVSRCYPDERRQIWTLEENNGATSWKEIGVGTGHPAWVTTKYGTKVIKKVSIGRIRISVN